MKGVIVEIRGLEAAVLTDDGQFVRVANDNYAVGQTVEVREKTKPRVRSRRFVRTMAAAIAAALMLTVGVAAYETPYGVVSVDADSSVSFTINRFDRVLAVSTDNTDEAAPDFSDLRHKPVSDAVSTAIDRLQQENGITADEECPVVVAVGTKSDVHSKKLTEKLDRVTDDHPHIPMVTACVSPEEMRRARDRGITPGRLWLEEQGKPSGGGGNNAPDSAAAPESHSHETREDALSPDDVPADDARLNEVAPGGEMNDPRRESLQERPEGPGEADSSPRSPANETAPGSAAERPAPEAPAKPAEDFSGDAEGPEGKEDAEGPEGKKDAPAFSDGEHFDREQEERPVSPDKP